MPQGLVQQYLFLEAQQQRGPRRRRRRGSFTVRKDAGPSYPRIRAAHEGEALLSGPAGARLALRSAASLRESSASSVWRLGPCSAAPSSGLIMTLPGTGATVPRCQPNQLGLRAVPLLCAVPCADRASSGVSAESGARGAARAAATPTAPWRVHTPQRRSRRALARRGQLGAPPTRAGARGGAWARYKIAHTALERTARPAGAWAHTRADRHVIRASLAKRARRSQAAKGGEGRRGLRARAREGVKRARRVLLRAAGRLLAARGRAA